MLCAFVFKSFLGIWSENALHRELYRNLLFRELCGFQNVLSLHILDRFRAKCH
ncbi:MAG: transposase [Candidatus Hodarchaeota archaeon]